MKFKMMKNIKLKVIGGTFSICRLPPKAPIPMWATQNSFYSISKTEDELSIVCPSDCVPKEVRKETDWELIKVEGPLDFALTGILNSLTKPLAEAKISIFAVSTFDTDYLLVKKENLETAIKALENQGFHFI